MLFQVKVLPDSADPLDINYNVIQWVHRSTRGLVLWRVRHRPSYGRDFKRACFVGFPENPTGLSDCYRIIANPSKEKKTSDPRMLEMALARLRQLSAHEVGPHTWLVFTIFAASTNDRASVMGLPTSSGDYR